MWLSTPNWSFVHIVCIYEKKTKTNFKPITNIVLKKRKGEGEREKKWIERERVGWCYHVLTVCLFVIFYSFLHLLWLKKASSITGPCVINILPNEREKARGNELEIVRRCLRTYYISWLDKKNITAKYPKKNRFQKVCAKYLHLRPILFFEAVFFKKIDLVIDNTN